MKFKLIEKFDETRSMVQEYMYDAIDELNNASLEEYIQWFKSELTYYDDEVERAVKDAYIEACDYGMIKGVEKTRLTSELKEYIESHADIIDDTDELMRQCPGHLQHELTLVLDKIDDSLNEELYPELRQFFGKTKNKTYNDHGTTRLHSTLINKLGFMLPEGNDYYAIHHVDGEHFKQNTENELLLLQSDHNRIHSDMMKDILNDESFTIDSVRYKLGYIAKVQQINTYIEKLNEYKETHKESLTGVFDNIEFTPQHIEFDTQKFEDLGKQALFRAAKNFLDSEDVVVIRLPFKQKHKYVVTLSRYFKPGLPDQHLKSIIIE